MLKLTISRSAIFAMSLVLSSCATLQGAGSPKYLKLASGLKDGPISGSLGEGLDMSAKNRALEAEYRALESGLTGAPVKWSDGADTKGTVIPEQVYEVGGSTCRRYKHQITIDGKVKSDIGTACKSESGMWATVD